MEWHEEIITKCSYLGELSLPFRSFVDLLFPKCNHTTICLAYGWKPVWQQLLFSPFCLRNYTLQHFIRGEKSVSRTLEIWPPLNTTCATPIDLNHHVYIVMMLKTRRICHWTGTWTEEALAASLKPTLHSARHEHGVFSLSASFHTIADIETMHREVFVTELEKTRACVKWSHDSFGLK